MDSAPDRGINVELLGYDRPPAKPLSVNDLTNAVRKFASGVN